MAASPSDGSSKTPVSVGSSSVRVITFGDASGPGNLRGARAVAVSLDNEIWVADQTKARLQVYRKLGSMEGCTPGDVLWSGYILRQFAPGLGYPGKEPVNVSFDRDPDVAISVEHQRRYGGQIRQGGRSQSQLQPPEQRTTWSIPRNGDQVTYTCKPTAIPQAFQKFLWGVDPQQRMKTPTKVAVSGEGNIYVSDYTCHYVYHQTSSRTVRLWCTYTTTRRYAWKFGGPGKSGGRLNRPEGI
ncbi:hypothetical protein Bbelb_244230 [Branchiostoma belcheri]|nr:hypothetical protein Bbelb_244230 [Branchiostoma belcheri]